MESVGIRGLVDRVVFDLEALPSPVALEGTSANEGIVAFVALRDEERY